MSFSANLINDSTKSQILYKVPILSFQIPKSNTLFQHFIDQFQYLKIYMLVFEYLLWRESG